MRYIVLIETLWNVKIKNVRFPPVQLLRINRNIVECKENKNRMQKIVLRINRNIVECKDKYGAVTAETERY